MNRQVIFFWVPMFALIVAFQIVTMPRELYAGDSNAIRLIAMNLAANGEFGIGYSQRNLESIREMTSTKGQYFLENDNHRRLYSRWGEMNTLLYALPEYFRNSRDMAFTPDIILYSNGLNIIFVVLIGLYIVLIGQGMGTPPLAVFGFLIATLYGSFLWNYSRAQTYEIFQIFFFMAYFYHFFRALDRRSDGELALSQILLLALIHCKILYALLYASSALAVYLTDQRERRRTLSLLVLSGLIGIFSHFSILFYKTGALQLGAEGAAIPGTPGIWGAHNLLPRLEEYTIGSKGSLLLHFPLLLLAVWYWPSYARINRSRAIFLLSSFALVSVPLLLFYTRGEFCLGPRYYLFILPALTLPVLLGFRPRQNRVQKGSLALMLLLVTCTYGFFQWQFNSRPFFLRHSLYGLLAEGTVPSELAKTYLTISTDLKIAADFNQFLKNNRDFPPMHDLLEQKQNLEAVRQVARERLDRILPCNFYFAKLCP